MTPSRRCRAADDLSRRAVTIILLVALVSAELLWPAAVAFSQGSVGQPALGVRDLHVSPAVLWSGSTVRVEAVVVNHGNAEAQDLRLGVAVAEAGVLGKRWFPLHRSPADPVARLGPGESVRFSATARLEGDGWFRVGVAGAAANAVLTPAGRRVRVVEPGATSTQAGMVFAVYAVLLSVATAIGWFLFRSPGGTPAVIPDWRLVSSGIGLMVVGPGVLWSIRQSLVTQAGGVAFAPPSALLWLPPAGAALFAIGWIALRRRSAIT